MSSRREEFAHCCWDQSSKLLGLKIAGFFCKGLRLLGLRIAGVWHNCGPSAEHGCSTVQRTRVAAAIGRCFWLTERTHRFWRGFLSQAITWFAADRGVRRGGSGAPAGRVGWLKRFALQLLKGFALKRVVWLERDCTPVAVQWTE